MKGNISLVFEFAMEYGYEARNQNKFKLNSYFIVFESRFILEH